MVVVNSGMCLSLGVEKDFGANSQLPNKILILIYVLK